MLIGDKVEDLTAGRKGMGIFMYTFFNYLIGNLPAEKKIPELSEQDK